ncbi:MAG: hypothetical protein FJ279_21710 [Planctomycetes bacterium]|nr:hypothetical protein [Planctomycetota bacterium]MBM4080138.1 hypothetical protein [Planctomycetota bacterium]MBM4085112.1 hypothetical protein [Planctomycetota bacterium]
MTDESQWLEKRACKRFPIPDAKVRYKKPGLLVLIRGFAGPVPVRNLSKGGVSFECDEGFEHDQELALELLVPMESPIEIVGQVKWQRRCQSGAHRFDIGIQFLPFGKSRGFNSMEALERLRALDRIYAEQPPVAQQPRP